MGVLTVLIVNPGADVYGSDLQMLESVSGLVERGHRVVLLCPNDGPLLELARARGATVEVLPFPVVRRSYLSPAGLVRLAADLARRSGPMRDHLRRHRPDVVYVNTTTIPWWIAIARAARLPVLCHVHEAEEKDGALVLRALNAPLLLADRVVLISRTSADSVWRLFPRLRRRSVVVMNGVPDRDVPPVHPPGKLVLQLAVLGRLSPRKGTHVAIRALAELRRRGVPAELEIAGSVFPGYEWYEEQLRDEVDQLGLRGRVRFTGYVSPSRVTFDRADVVLAPSVREPFGNAVVEAMLSERPVVAAAWGGHLESIDDGWTGLHVPLEDPVATADAVQRLAADPELARDVATTARRAALARFSTDRYRASIEAVCVAMAATGQPLDDALSSPLRLRP